MNNIKISSLPNIEVDSVIVEKIPVGDTTACGEVSGPSNFQLFRVQFDDKGISPSSVFVRQEHLAPCEQGDFFVVYGLGQPQNFERVAIETEYASSPENVVAQAALFAQLLQD